MRRATFAVAFFLLIAVTASATPSLGFTTVPASPVAGQPVRFEPRAAFDPNAASYSYTWDFGDLQSSYEEKPVHAYLNGGSYTVMLVVVDTSNNSRRTSMQTVTVAAAPNRPPVARFSFSPANPLTGQTVTFTNTSVDPDPDTLTYTWTFGDGATSSETNPAHSYGATGNYTVTLTANDGRGGSNSTTQSVAVTQANRAPTASIRSTVVSVTGSGTTVEFDGSASTDPDGNALTFSWDFGDATGSSAMAPRHLYARPDTYRVRLTVSDGQASHTAEAFVTTAAAENRPPVAAFTLEPARATVGQTVLFHNASTDPDGDALRFTWDFDDGGASELAEPAHAFATAGDYIITLWADDNRANGRVSTQRTITVDPPPNRPPQANFTYAPANPVAGQSVAFTNTSTDWDGDALSYSWTFDNGQTSADVNPVILYDAAGTYNITLSANDGHYEPSVKTQTIVVAPAVQSNRPPNAVFTFTIVSVNASGATVAFDAGQSSDPDSDPLRFTWDFGDRTEGEGIDPQHVYAGPNTYTVKLTVWDRFTSTTVQQNVTTIAPPNQTPTAGFTISPERPYAGQTVQFTNTSTDPDLGDSLRYTWDFHDGGTSTLANPTHVFTTAGEYIVRLIADDNHLNGYSSFDLAIVVDPAVNHPPEANFTITPSQPFTGQTITFTNTTTDRDAGDSVTYAWTFGDGTTSTDKNPAKEYGEAGAYQVSLTATDSRGATGTMTKELLVEGNRRPLAAFTWNVSSVDDSGTVVAFDATGSSDPDNQPLTYTWTFGDGSASPGFGVNVNHVYAAGGTYRVTLTVSDTLLSASQTQDVLVTAVSPVTVTPDAQVVKVATGATGTQTFTVKNVGTATVTYDISRTCTGAMAACGNPSSTSLTLAPGASQQVTMPYTAATTDGAATIALKAAQRGVPANWDSGSYSVTVSSALAFSLAPHNGDNLNVSQFTVTLDYTTPAYVSMDEDRALTLFYSSGQSSPRALIQVDVTDATPPQQYSIFIKDQDGNVVPLSDGRMEEFYQGGTGGTSRLAAQVALGNLATGAYAGTVYVRRWNGGVASQSAQPVRVLVVNERNSPYGAGWTIAGLQRIHEQSNGALVVTAGDGSVVYFARPAGCANPCTYVSPAGEWTTIAFDGSQYIRSYRNGSRALFDGNGSLTATMDVFGNTTRYVYEGGRLRQVIDPLSANDASPRSKLEIAYFAGGYTITDPSGRTTTVQLNAANDVVGITGPDNVRVYTMQDSDYTSAHQLLGWTDRLGGRWDVAYDGLMMLAGLTKPGVTINGVAGVRTEAKYQSLAGVIIPGASSGGSLSNPAPRIIPPVRISSTDPRGFTSWISVDRFGNPIAAANALGQVTTITRDENSLVQRVATPSGASTRYDYYAGTPLVKSVTNEVTGKAVHYEYDSQFDRIKRVSGSTREQQYSYNGLLEIFEKKALSDGTFATSRIALQPDGRVASIASPKGTPQTYAYETTTSYTYTSSADNPWSNLSIEVAGTTGSMVTTFKYDSAGRQIRTDLPSDALTPPSGSRTVWDALNRPIEMYDGLGSRTRIDYEEANGRMTKRLTDANGNIYSQEYNTLGLLERQIDPTQKATTYWYDKTGNLQAIVNRRGNVVVFTHDALNRVVSRTDRKTGEQTGWSYDPSGRRVTVTSPESTNVLDFDADGRSIQEQVVMNGSTYVMAAAYSHPKFDARTEFLMTAPWQRQILYQYDGRTGLFNGLRDGYESWLTIQHDDADQAFVRHIPNVGIYEGVTSQDETSSVSFRKDADGSLLHPGLGSEYGLDALGRISTRWNSSLTSAETFKYDAAGRLTELWSKSYAARPVTCSSADAGLCPPPGGPGTRAALFTYDALGNRTDKPSFVDPGNRLRAFDNLAMTYDDDGNLVTKSGGGVTQSLDWDGLGRLRSVTTNGVLTTFGYDGLGRRVRKTTGGQTIRYLYNRENLFMELNGSGQPLREYAFQPEMDRPFSVRYAGSSYYFLLDRPGHVAGLTDYNGVVVAQYRYGVWGSSGTAPSGVVENNLRYGARELDAETGLYYNRARYYDPSVGRFISEDPFGLDAGLNLYTYVDNDPVNKLDPTGLTPECTPLREYLDMSLDQAARFEQTGQTVCGASGRYMPAYEDKRALVRKYMRALRTGTAMPGDTLNIRIDFFTGSKTEVWSAPDGPVHRFLTCHGQNADSWARAFQRHRDRGHDDLTDVMFYAAGLLIDTVVGCGGEGLVGLFTK